MEIKGNNQSGAHHSYNINDENEFMSASASGLATLRRSSNYALLKNKMPSKIQS
jgi:hypothetical protein